VSIIIVIFMVMDSGEKSSVVLQVGFQAIAEALGLAAVKAAVAITAIIAGGRLVSFRYLGD
jgi:hypothetical protein